MQDTSRDLLVDAIYDYIRVLDGKGFKTAPLDVKRAEGEDHRVIHISLDYRAPAYLAQDVKEQLALVGLNPKFNTCQGHMYLKVVVEPQHEAQFIENLETRIHTYKEEFSEIGNTSDRQNDTQTALPNHLVEIVFPQSRIVNLPKTQVNLN